MLFNSFAFALFFALVFPLYLVFRHKGQNRLLLAASYFFYGFWDWRFTALLLLSTVLDFAAAHLIHKIARPFLKKMVLGLTITLNLSILGFFKYAGFFAQNLEALLAHWGVSPSSALTQIVLPVGISFYTFQSMSYTIDVFRGRIVPIKSLADFALFVSFFPQLVAGPIERATNLLPQVTSERKVTLDGVYEGSFLIFWGLFQKIFVADGLAHIADPVFARTPASGFEVLLALYAFAFQIYCDFAGYSNIARGLARCMGFNLMVNFNLPYFATGASDFWHRWHISLSSWLKDYLYISLGGSRKGTVRTYVNLLLTMLLGGFWHGASWNFILWGGYHGLLLCIYRLLEERADALWQKITFGSKLCGVFWLWVKRLVFFHLVCLGWLFFRERSLEKIKGMLAQLFFNFDPSALGGLQGTLFDLYYYLAPLLVFEFYQHIKKDQLAVYRSNVVVRALFYLLCFYLMFYTAPKDAKDFIYFQF